MMATPARRVVVVDDDPDILAYYASVLTQAGYDVVTAQSAAEARAAAAARRPDALVLDISMPEEDGLSLAGRLYEGAQTRDIPIVLVTARVDMKDGLPKLICHDIEEIVEK